MNINLYKKYLSVLLVSILTLNNLISQNNYIDLTYCADGTCTVELPFMFSNIKQLSFDSQDNLYITVLRSSPFDDYYLARVTKDGILDISFGNGGIFSEDTPGYVTYQKEDYIFSLRTTGGATAVNIYDLELNFIQRYILADEARIDNLYFNGEYFIGSTINAFIFKYNIDGTIDVNFGENGVLNIQGNITGLAIDGYAYSTEQDIHYCYKSDHPSSQLLHINNSGETTTTQDITPSIQDSTLFIGPFNLVSTVKESFNGYTIIGHSHLGANFLNYQDEYQKVNRDGLFLEFGDQGSIIPPILQEGFANLVGELQSENLVIIYDTDNIIANSAVQNKTSTLLIMTPQGTNNVNFGIDGFLNFSIIPGQLKFTAQKSRINDHVYIASATGETSSLFITKLDLEELPGTAITSKVKYTSTDASLNLYPNPSDANTKLIYTGPPVFNIRIELINTIGQLINVINIDNLRSSDEINIDTRHLEDGLYFVKLIDSKKVIQTHQLVVNH